MHALTIQHWHVYPEDPHETVRFIFKQCRLALSEPRHLFRNAEFLGFLLETEDGCRYASSVFEELSKVCFGSNDVPGASDENTFTLLNDAAVPFFWQ